MSALQPPVLAANWKMNHGPSEARAFMQRFLDRYRARADRTVIFFPSALTLGAVAEALAGRSDIAIGVQNIWTEDKGAFTGENSALIARDTGARYVLVGHSERRHVFGESDAETAKKCAAAARHGLVPILCVGEKLSERESGVTHDVVRRQLRTGIAELERDAVASMAIAYEPIWAIGTGRTATPDDASAVHAVLRDALRDVLRDAAGTGSNASGPPILYGGSVNTGNAKALLAAPGVDGLLVGGASLEADGWAGICDT
jgi:triosephosphate isomerase